MRVGKFRIHNQVIWDQMDMLVILFSTLRIVPIQIDQQFFELVNIYTAYCPYFDELPEGQKVPEYDFSWVLSPDGKRLAAAQINGKQVYPIAEEQVPDKDNIFW